MFGGKGGKGALALRLQCIPWTGEELQFCTILVLRGVLSDTYLQLVINPHCLRLFFKVITPLYLAMIRRRSLVRVNVVQEETQC